MPSCSSIILSLVDGLSSLVASPKSAILGIMFFEFSPVKRTKVIMAAVDSPTTLVVDLRLHNLLSFDELAKNLFVSKLMRILPGFRSDKTIRAHISQYWTYNKNIPV